MAEENSTEQNPSEAVALKKPGNALSWVFHPFGAKALKMNGNLGAMAIFLFRSFFMIFHYKQFSAIVQQIYFIGAKSAQIVMLVGFFTGLAQGKPQIEIESVMEFARFNQKSIARFQCERGGHSQ